MKHAIGSATFAAVLTCGLATAGFAAGTLPGETGGGQGEVQQGQQGNQQNLEQDRVQQGIGRSGDLPMQDRGIRQPGNQQSPQIKDEHVTLGGANPTVKGEVLKVDGENYVIRDASGK